MELSPRQNNIFIGIAFVWVTSACCLHLLATIPNINVIYNGAIIALLSNLTSLIQNGRITLDIKFRFAFEHQH